MSKIVMTNANIIDVVGDLGGLGTLTIVGERIACIVPGMATAMPDDAQVFDLRGRAVMPGMFSCHYHASYPGLPLAAKRRYSSNPQSEGCKGSCAHFPTMPVT